MDPSGTGQGTDKTKQPTAGQPALLLPLPVLSVAGPAPSSAALPPAAWLPPTAGLSGLLPQPFSSPALAAPWLSSPWPAEKVPELENQKGSLSTETERRLVHKQHVHKPSPTGAERGTDTHGHRRAGL